MRRRACIWLLTAALASCLGATPACASSSGDFIIPPKQRPSPLDELTAAGGPTAAGLGILTAHARGRVVRLTLADRRLDSPSVRFDSLGVAVDTQPAIHAWRDIRSLETRHSHVVLGIVLGTLVGFAAAAAVADAAGSDPGPGIIVVLVIPPASALLGGLVGGQLPRWQHEWPPATAKPAEAR